MSRSTRSTTAGERAQPANFGSRIRIRMLYVDCAYCGADSGQACLTGGGNYAQDYHHARFLTAREELTAEGDGPDGQSRSGT